MALDLLRVGAGSGVWSAVGVRLSSRAPVAKETRAMPLLSGEPIYTGGESWHNKFVPPAGTEAPDPNEPYDAWRRTWHLHPGLESTGQFETTAPVVSSVLLARPWDAPAMRTETSTGPMGWRAAMEGVSVVTDDPWAFEIDRRNGKLKCLACCASATGICNLDSCGLKPPPVPQEFLARGGGEAPYRPPKLAPLPPQPHLGGCDTPGALGFERTPQCGTPGAHADASAPPHAQHATPPPSPSAAGAAPRVAAAAVLSVALQRRNTPRAADAPLCARSKRAGRARRRARLLLGRNAPARFCYANL